MKPSATRQIELDFIRGVAILLVLHFHFSSANIFVYNIAGLPLINFGWAGVDLFFVLSGFLVGGLLCKEWLRSGTVDAKRFLTRRAFKIWPGYYALIAAYVITRKQPLNTFLWQNVLNVQNYAGTSISHTWSLAVEEHFYILLSLSAWWCASRKVPIRRFFFGLGVVAVSVTVYRTWLGVSGHGLYFFQTHTRIDALMLGVMLAIIFHFSHDRFLQLQNRRYLLGVVLVASVAALLISPQFKPNGPQVIAADLGSGALLLLSYKPNQGSHGRLYKLVANIGLYSYGIYLWHTSVTGPVVFLVHRLNLPWAEYPVRLVSAIVLGAIMTKLIEFPFLRLRETVMPAAVKPRAVFPSIRQSLSVKEQSMEPEHGDSEPASSRQLV